MEFEIFVIRHGQTNLNLEHRLQGSGCDFKLNETGRNQARSLSDSKILPNNAEIICSPMRRTIETAEIACNKERDEIKIDKRIIDRNMGNFEGNTKAENAKILEKYENISMYECHEEGVERTEEYMGRLKSFLRDLTLDCKQKLHINHPRSIIVVTHCGCSHYLMQLVADMIPNLNPQIKEDCNRKWPLNTAYSKFKINFDSDQNSSFEICFLCCSDHLSSLKKNANK